MVKDAVCRLIKFDELFLGKSGYDPVTIFRKGGVARVT